MKNLEESLGIIVEKKDDGRYWANPTNLTGSPPIGAGETKFEARYRLLYHLIVDMVADKRVYKMIAQKVEEGWLS